METTTLIFLFILVWGILGVTFLCIGIGLHVRERKKRNTCTLPVTATVVDLRRERVGVDDFSVSGEAALKSWFPIYEYTVGGVTQRAKAFIGTAKPEVEVGQAVELFVNPDCIEEFYCPTEKASKGVYRSGSSVSVPCSHYGRNPLVCIRIPGMYNIANFC